MAARYELPARFDRLQNRALIVGVICLIIGCIGAIFSRPEFYNSWLFAWFFVLGIALGGLAITMLHHLTGGAWGLAIRRECEAAALTLPLMLLLFLPLLFGFQHLFPWANPDMLKGDKVLEFQAARYFNPGLLIARVAFYFLCWITMAGLLCSETLQFEATNDYRLVRRMRKISAGGLVLIMVTITMATFDFVMSREPHFYSSVIGFMTSVGMALSALSLVVALLWFLVDQPDLHNFLTGDVLNDLGNLMLTLVILWAYMNFSQLLIVWMGNINHETPWYIHRGLGQKFNWWKSAGTLLLVFHFFVPFLILLSRDAKRRLATISTLAIVLFAMRALDVYYLIAPSGPETGRAHATWMDFPLIVGMFGIWFFVFVSMLRRRPLVARAELDEEEVAEQAQRDAQKHGGAPGANPA